MFVRVRVTNGHRSTAVSIGYSIPDYTAKDLKPSAVDSMFPPEDILDLQGYKYQYPPYFWLGFSSVGFVP